MHPFEISKDMVARLADESLRQLLDRLLSAEARKLGVPLGAIIVGGNQTAPDGGVDASVEWNGDPNPGDRLPRRKIYYQCKAQSMGPAEIGREMKPKGVLRPIFAELAAERGAYIIVSTDDVGSKGVEARIARMRNELGGLANPDDIAVDFFGADRVARWVNEHLGVAVWLLEQCGRPLTGWRPYGGWSSTASADAAYLIDDSVRVSLDANDVDAGSAIEAMRGTLAASGGCVRLVGISGMGKTRLAEALFDERVGAGAAPCSSLAIYADAGHELGTGAALVAEQLVLAGVEAIMIVDSCAAHTHRQLVEIVRRKGSRVALLTIDYNIGEDQPEATSIVRLGANSESLVLSLLEQRHPELSDGERRHLARFSDGNARVALAIARGAAEGVDLSQLGDSGLLDRLFQSGRTQDGAGVRKAADAASLVYAFHTDATNKVPVEHSVLARIAGMSPDAFYRQVQIMLDWGIAQQRGPQRAIKPDPIANRLARKVLHESDPEALLDAFRSGPERLLASFARRLGQLHDLVAARRIAERLLAEGEWLGDPTSHNDHQQRAFLNIAPSAPDAALGTLERALASEASASLLTTDHRRRDIADLLAHLAYDEDLFPRAMRALLKVALADGPERGATARDYFLQRFWPVFSWTLAKTEPRLAIADQMLDDDRDEVRALGVEALDHMIDAGHFSSSFDPEFGSQLRDREWRPQGRLYLDWIDAAYRRLERTTLSSEPEADRARQIIAEHFREHLDAGVGDRAVAAMRSAKPDGYWDAGWRAANDALHFSGGEKSHGRSLASVLEKELRPKSLDDCFEAFVIGEPWRHWHPSGRHNSPTRNVETLAKAIGQRLVRSGAAAEPFLRRAMLASGQTSVAPFGQGLGRIAVDLRRLWTAAYQIYSEVAEEERNPGVLFGIVSAADKRDPGWVDDLLDRAMADPLLREYAVHLHASRALGAKDVERFLTALEQGGISPERLGLLMYGGATSTIPAADLARLLDAMILIEDGAIPALEVLYMRAVGDKQLDRPLAPELIAIAKKLLTDVRCYEADRNRTDHELAGLARRVFAAEPGPDTSTAICRALRRVAGSKEYWRRQEMDELAKVLMTTHARVVLDEIVLTANSDGRRDLAGVFFGGWSADADHHEGREQVAIDRELVRAWVSVDSQARAERLADLVPYTATGATGDFGWSSIALELIEAAPDPIRVLHTFENRFWTGVSSGPFSSRYVRRRPLVAALADHRDRRVRNWARETAEAIEARIKHYDAMDRETDSRFE